MAVTGAQCLKHCVLGIVHLLNLPYLCTRFICINYKAELSHGTIKNVFHQLCLSAREYGTRDAEVYESLSCTVDELGTETGQHSGRLDDVRQRLEPYYDILDFHVEGAMLYFRARKR